jgi:4-hydroxyphenylacetate 3-monooxygenase
MLKPGNEHLESLRDGRVIYLCSERIEDIATHPAFRNAAHTVTALYDMKADLAHRETITYQEDGRHHSIYYLRLKMRDDLQRRMLGHCIIADLTSSMFGHSPDHVASFVTGMAMKLDELKPPYGYPDHLLTYYWHIRDHDLYTVYAVLPPQATRDPAFYQQKNRPVPTLCVVREEKDDVVSRGVKMLAPVRAPPCRRAKKAG